MRPSIVIVLALLPVSLGSCLVADVLPGTPCQEHVERTLTVTTPADPPLELRLESCRRDVGACMDLCGEAMSRLKLDASPQKCAVAFDGDRAELQVAYDIYHGGNNCPVTDQGLPGGKGQPGTGAPGGGI